MDWAALRAAVEAGGDLNAVNPAASWKGRSTVLHAVLFGAPLEVVKWMHDSTEAEFTAVDRLGRTAVHMACSSSQCVSHEAAAGVVEYLVSVVGLQPVVVRLVLVLQPRCRGQSLWWGKVHWPHRRSPT